MTNNHTLAHVTAESYDVLVDEHHRMRVHPVDVARHELPAPATPQPWWAEPPTAGGVLRMVWRVVVRVLELLGPADSPHVIAVIKAPERMYCANCGTERVAQYCPICGRNVDRQYRKMIKKMARYVADGTADRRASIEAALRAEIDRSVAHLQGQHRRLLQEKLEQLERNYVMEIARHQKTIRLLLAAQATDALPPPATPALQSPDAHAAAR